MQRLSFKMVAFFIAYFSVGHTGVYLLFNDQIRCTRINTLDQSIEANAVPSRLRTLTKSHYFDAAVKIG